jgi:signal transduction histidine kinase
MMASQRGRWRWPTADRAVLALAAVVLVLAAASNDDASDVVDPRSIDVLAVVLLGIGGALVAAGGRWPASVAAAAMGLTFLWYGLGYESGLVNVVTLAAFYRLGLSARHDRKLAVVGVSVAASLVMIVGVGGDSWWAGLTASGYVVMAVLFGDLIRSRHLLVAQYAAEAERAQRDAERRIAEERLLIARDVHDLLAHTVASMTVQAGVAADALDRDQTTVRRALADIRTAGRSAMDELRSTVSLLRSGAEPLATAPAPRLAAVADLVEAARTHGTEVQLVLDPPAEPLPELVELTAYRVVQESLTNVVRHADATTATVSIRTDDRHLIVEVNDDGSPTVDPSPGFGLRGMAERVESLGGQLWHGPDSTGGWTVRAELPITGGR